ncbi:MULTISPECIES: S-layer homology domain-containing protein [Bacillaceae]|uniref:SLH domain-containing protein n=1 Tax=Domibacillus aminovorans TaxID=29332 RepID=A0A177L1K3_9BACI|nr:MULTISPECIES: S-layer homology domain-containing protein [Bacillaceae]OAH59274.1 hypothetical protein AWH48_16170 [Domibacillus aminovorans]
MKKRCGTKDVRKDHWARGNITWAFRTGLIQGYPDGRFQLLVLLKEADFTVIAAKYLGLKPGATYGHRTQQYYDFFKPYNLPLKGYTNDTAKNGTVTRGQLAQVIAARKEPFTDQKQQLDLCIRTTFRLERLVLKRLKTITSLSH